MSVSGATSKTRDKALASRIVAAVLAAFLVLFFQGLPLQDAYAASSKAASSAKDAKDSAAGSDKNTSKSASTKSDSKSLSTPNKKKEDEEAKKEAEEEEKRKEEAEAKWAEAKSYYAQASSAQASLDKARAKYEEASAALDEANELLDQTQVEYDEKTVEIEKLQDNLSDYVVDMYKQGGSAPYIDVMLGATSYREFLTSWNMAVTVNDYGHGLVAEKKQMRETIEKKLADCKDQVEEAKRDKALADANCRQLNATRLSYLVQAAQASIEAAEIEEDKSALKEARKELSSAQKELDEAIDEGLAGESLLSGKGYFTHPCPDSTVSSGFGYRSFDNAVHKGIDFAAPEGTPYYAADKGTVTAATNGGGDNGGAGNWIVIDHGNGVVTKYMHSLLTFVKPGDKVERGQNIGLVGTTGQSTGPHLHFQVEVGGVAVNPVGYL